MKKDLNRYYKSNSFPLVSFLYAKGETICGLRETSNSNVKEFVFNRTPRLEGLIYTFNFGDKNDEELLVNVRVYDQARKELLDLLKRGGV